MWNAGHLFVPLFFLFVLFLTIKAYKTLSRRALFSAGHSKFSLLTFFVTFWLILLGPVVFGVELFGKEGIGGWKDVINLLVASLLGAALAGVCVQLAGVLLKE